MGNDEKLTEYYCIMFSIEKNHTSGTCDIRMEIKMTMNQMERDCIVLDQKGGGVKRRSGANCGTVCEN